MRNCSVPGTMELCDSLVKELKDSIVAVGNYWNLQIAE